MVIYILLTAAEESDVDDQSYPHMLLIYPIKEVIRQAIAEGSPDTEAMEEELQEYDQLGWQPITALSRLKFFDFTVPIVRIRDDLVEPYFDKSPVVLYAS